MSVSIVFTRAQLGLTAISVSVETHISNGLPSLSIVGMPETSVREAKERVRSALINAGFEFPTRRITINLAPADLPKQGGRYDLAIAVGILAATDQFHGHDLSAIEFIGELALTGAIRSVSGVLPTAIACKSAQRKLAFPIDDFPEAARVSGLDVLPVAHINQLVRVIQGAESVPEPAEIPEPVPQSCPDLSEVKGQHLARRALEIAAAGNLNLLFYGPPGTGKSMLASRLIGILPPLSSDEALEVASVYSVSARAAHEQSTLSGLMSRPFRAPHHSASAVALIGGGSMPMPGEVSLAHRGVLFLDELPEYDRRALEMLREPIETGHVMISRAARSVSYPASFQLVAAMNPCPCGFLGHPRIPCSDSPQQIYQYRRKLSGPLLDRFDMHVEVGYQRGETLLDTDVSEESSLAVRSRVVAAREIQTARQGKENSRLQLHEMAVHCDLSPELKAWLQSVMDQLALSARAAHRIIRLARTIADLEGADELLMAHLSEAIAYRALDRQRTTNQ